MRKKNYTETNINNINEEIKMNFKILKNLKKQPNKFEKTQDCVNKPARKR